MATPITISIPHQLGRAEARRRIEAGFAKIIHLLPGSAGNCSERWDGDRLIFGVAAMGQTVAGVINVLDAAVMMEIEVPSVFGMIASGLRDPQGSAPEGGTAATYEGVAQCRSRLGASEQGAKSLAGKPFGLLSADPDNRSPYLAGRSA
jgi:hypothetical protein